MHTVQTRAHTQQKQVYTFVTGVFSSFYLEMQIYDTDWHLFLVLSTSIKIYHFNLGDKVIHKQRSVTPDNTTKDFEKSIV